MDPHGLEANTESVLGALCTSRTISKVIVCGPVPQCSLILGMDVVFAFGAWCLVCDCSECSCTPKWAGVLVAAFRERRDVAGQGHYNCQ